MEGMIMTVQLLLSLSILIVVHEGGHFLAARMFNIKVEKFYLFFDFLFPAANVLNFSLFKFKKGDTEYGIGWFPLGGYVKIAGMVDESMDKDQLKLPPQPWEYRSKPAWQRLIVMMGGIIVNVIVGILIFTAMTYFLGDTYIPKKVVNDNGGVVAMELGKQIGFQTGDKIIKINGKDFEDFQEVLKPDVLLSEGSFYTVLRDGKEVNIAIPSNFIEHFNKKESGSNFISPRLPAVVGFVSNEYKATEDAKPVATIASRIGLKPGDQFIEIDGHPVAYQDEVTQLVKGAGPRDSISFKIKRGDQVIAYHENFKDQAIIGFLPKGLDKKELVHIQYGVGESVVLGTSRAFGIIGVQLKAFKQMIAMKLSVGKSLSGPIGMAQAYGGEFDWEKFWKMTGMLSMVLAFMNFLPIPGLDGGYVVFLIYQMVTGREPSEKVFENSLRVGMALLFGLMIFAFYNDIAKLFVK